MREKHFLGVQQRVRIRPGKPNTTDIILEYTFVYIVDDVGQTKILCKIQNALKNNDVFYPENFELRAGYISLILYFAKQTNERKKKNIAAKAI